MATWQWNPRTDRSNVRTLGTKPFHDFSTFQSAADFFSGFTRGPNDRWTLLIDPGEYDGAYFPEAGDAEYLSIVARVPGSVTVYGVDARGVDSTDQRAIDMETVRETYISGIQARDCSRLLTFGGDKDGSLWVSRCRCNSNLTINDGSPDFFLGGFGGDADAVDAVARFDRCHSRTWYDGFTPRGSGTFYFTDCSTEFYANASGNFHRAAIQARVAQAGADATQHIYCRNLTVWGVSEEVCVVGTASFGNTNALRVRMTGTYADLRGTGAGVYFVCLEGTGPGWPGPGLDMHVDNFNVAVNGSGTATEAVGFRVLLGASKEVKLRASNGRIRATGATTNYTAQGASATNHKVEFMNVDSQQSWGPNILVDTNEGGATVT